MEDILAGIQNFIAAVWDNAELLTGFSAYVTFISRLFLPLLGFIIVLRSAVSLLSRRGKSEVWGYLTLPNGAKIELRHWENIIGRSASSDVLMDYPSVSRSHAAIIRNGSGTWTVIDLGGKMGTEVRGKKLKAMTTIKSGDVLNVGGVETVFFRSTGADKSDGEDEESVYSSVPTLFVLTVFMAILCVTLCLNVGEAGTIIFAFFSEALLMWGSYFITRTLDRAGFELETLIFFLCSIGFAVAASSDVGVLYKETICLVAGVLLYWLLGWFLRELKRARALRWYIAGAGLVLLVINVLTAESIFGARNWLSIGSISFQPSELLKICYVFAGTATLDRMFAKRNLVLFVAYAAVCVGGLVIMSDFGTALVFFTAYLVIAFMRSGSFSTIILSAAGAAFAAFIAITAKPYIADRFASWGNAWADPNGRGYQQARAMAACASGGFFGLGAGNGWLKNIFAADTDMVFAFVCEELGFIIALLSAAAIIVMALSAVRSAENARSTFYVIAACAASAIMLVQIILNIFGSLDILPFTGVTFPFVSKGGSSLIASWGLAAFIKACDTRRSASFAVKAAESTKRKRTNYEEN